MSRKDDIKQLIIGHQRRLQKLRVSQASRGLDTPPHILMEIEDIEAAIEELQTELKELEDSGFDTESPGVLSEQTQDIKPKQRVQIYLSGDFTSLSPHRRSAAIDAFAGAMGIPSQAIEVYSVYEGSIIFDLGVPPHAVQRLRFLLKSNSAQLRLLKVEKVIIEEESGQVEEWVIKERTFDLVTSTHHTIPSSVYGKSQRARKINRLKKLMRQPSRNPIAITMLFGLPFIGVVCLLGLMTVVGLTFGDDLIAMLQPSTPTESRPTIVTLTSVSPPTFTPTLISTDTPPPDTPTPTTPTFTPTPTTPTFTPTPTNTPTNTPTFTPTPPATYTPKPTPTPPILVSGPLFGTGTDRTFDLAFGDADNDNDLDLAVGNHGQNQICWNNNSSFDCEDAFGGNATFDVEWGHMNQDDDLDLVVANSSGQSNQVCLNNGDHTFTCASFSTCSGSGQFCRTALGDVDADGDLDVALSIWQSQISIYLNDGNGTFSTPTDISTSGWTRDLEFGDVDNDDDLDLIVVGDSPDYVFINDGTGTFTPQSFVWRQDSTRSVALGDVDGDDDLDIIAGENSLNPIEVYLNDGHGDFAQTLTIGSASDVTSDIAWADIDNDGDLDIVAGNLNQPNVYFNDPGPTFTRNEFLDTGPTSSVTFGDIDKDGDPDLAVGYDGEQNVIYLNTTQ